MITYVEEHGPEVEQMQKDIAANTKAISDEATRADTEEKRLAGLIGTNAENIQKNADAIAALNAADGKVANAEKADVASSLDEAAIAQVKGIVVDKATDADTLDGHDSTYFATAEQGAKADTAVQPAALNDYYTKGEVDEDVAALNEKIGDKSVSEQIAAAVAEVKSDSSNKDAVVLAEAQKSIAAAQTALEAEIAKKSNTADLAAIAFSGSTDDLVQGELVLIFNCGSASD